MIGLGKVSGIAKAHYLWAALCAIGYWGLMVPGATGALGIGGIIALWALLTAIGVAGMYYEKWVPDAPLNRRVALAWVVACLAGLAANALQFYRIFDLAPYGFNYAAVWFLVSAVGFAYTGYAWPKAKEGYYAGAALNLAGLAAILLKIGLAGQGVLLLLGIASVLPLLYAGAKN